MKLFVIRNKAGHYIRHFGIPTDVLDSARIFTKEQLRQYKKSQRKRMGPSVFDEEFEVCEVNLVIKTHP